MKNITVSVSEQTYRKARIWAAEHDVSVSVAVQFMLHNIRSILRVNKPPKRVRHPQRPANNSNPDCETAGQTNQP